jgi:broad specificity phosphatase PhoE
MKELWILRHSYKLSYFPKKWEKHSRYKENPFDEPLTSFGLSLAEKTGLVLAKKSKVLKDNKIKYIYCSPFTRCIQTAIQVIKSIKKIHGIELKIIILYGLGESLLYRPTVSFQNDTIKYTKPDYAPLLNGKKYKTKIDSKMSPTNLKKRFKNYIVGVISKPHGIETPEEESLRMFKVIKGIGDQQDSAIIIGHAHTVDLAYNYFIKPKTPLSSYSFGGPDHSCTMMGISQNEKELNSPWKLFYKPQTVATCQM